MKNSFGYLCIVLIVFVCPCVPSVLAKTFEWLELVTSVSTHKHNFIISGLSSSTKVIGSGSMSNE